MKRLAITTLSAATLALAACGHKDAASTDTSNTTMVADNGTVADAGTNNAMASDAPALSPGQTFANDAASSDAFEIATSKLALTSATSPAIKKFAQKMIDAHTASTAKLKTAAAGATPPITPDPTLTAEQQAKVDALKATSGPAFDTTYVTAQVDGHQATLDKLRAYSASGDVPTLKAFATTLTPTVAAHLNMAKALKP